ncbi:MAG: DNRLRE domain-containing protein [Taibaiella sp.]|nr:DNRLRE domain-containing protein [Taibaiella sp.]
MKQIVLFAFVIFAFTQSQAATDTITVRSNPSNSKFRYINNAPVDTGNRFGGNSMVIARWTTGGIPYTWRTLLKFDLPTLPTGATIDTAYLSVYANTTSPSGNPGSPTWGTDNAVGIYRLLSPWDTATLTWGTQPSFTTANGDTLLQSTTWTQDYVNVNITELIKDAYLYGNHGFLFKHLQEVNTLNSMIFYSPYSYTIDTNKTPRLKIKYTYPTSVIKQEQKGLQVEVFPNPANSVVSFKIDKAVGEILTVSLIDCTGRVFAINTIRDNAVSVTSSIDINGYPRGVYIARIEQTDGTIVNKKLLVY